MFESQTSVRDGYEGHFAGDDEWRVIERRLRSCAQRRAALDEEEARWLLAARRTALHLRFGFATLLEYLERVLGYGPHAAGERLRVAEALAHLPAMRTALRETRLNYSAVRELTRVVNADTEDAWIAAATGRTLRELEPMTAGRKPGALPGDPPAPGAAVHAVRFEVSGATLALLRDARIALAEQTGERLDDDALVAAMCRAVLDGPRDADQGRARHEIATTTCDTCTRAWQDGGGATVELSPAERAIAECDAVRIGRLDAPEPARAKQDIPPAVRRLVWRRDHGRCAIPGCRSTQHLDVHHLRPRSHGGDHAADNLILCCGAHHRAIHEGRLRLTGTVSSGLTIAHADGAWEPGALRLRARAPPRPIAAIGNGGRPRHTGAMGTGFQLLLALGVLATLLVFAGAFRFALRECAETRELACQPDIPRASIHGGERRWRVGSTRQRAVASVKLLQAGFVAVGITAVFVMTMCMAGIVLLMVFG